MRIVERRIRRSEQRELALRFQIDHARDQARLEALVLADEAGIALAESGDRAVCEELAAIAPLLGRTISMPMPPLLRGADVAVRTMRVHGQPLYLASIGGTVARDALLATSLRGVERILAAN
ncbi:hypothetical protein [Sandaracinus amylolyticus]|uniref:hypothetical protein n=1 Tax=Sandaracinus amylolyticus TaxID=927083 RepID=UPI00069F3C96|nr:hypothetical protein [Sandaracinus amylolyticus]